MLNFSIIMLNAATVTNSLVRTLKDSTGENRTNCEKYNFLKLWQDFEEIKTLMILILSDIISFFLTDIWFHAFLRYILFLQQDNYTSL